MIHAHEKGSIGTRGGCGDRGCSQCTYCKIMGHTQENRYSSHGFPNKAANISKSKGTKQKFSNEEYQEYFRLKSNSLAQSSTTPSLSTTCISHLVESKSMDN